MACSKLSLSYVHSMVKPPSFLSALSILSSLKYRKQLSGPYALEIRSLIKQKIQILLKSCFTDCRDSLCIHDVSRFAYKVIV